VTRYFERFYYGDPMDEISEAVALERGTYVVEEDGPLHRYRSILDGELRRVIYTGWDDPLEPRGDALGRAEGAAIEIYSPVERLPHGGHRYRTWYLDVVGTVKKILEPEVAADGRLLRQSLSGPDGELISYDVHRYDDNGWLIEIVTHAPDGTVTGRQDA
jgi:hypothetical protein